MTTADPMLEPEAPRPSRSLRRNTAIMASGTAVSRLLGFVRNALLVAVIGLNTGPAGAFDIAHRIPTVVYSILLSGVLNAVLVPQIVRALARRDGKRTVDRIITLGTAMLLGLTILLMIGAALLVFLFTQDWTPELRSLAIAFSLWSMPQVFFYGMYALLGQVLNAKERFGPYMWAPVANNVVSIVGLLAFLLAFGRYDAGADWGPGKIAFLSGFATLGIAAQAIVLIWPLARLGYRWRFRWSGPPGELAGVRKVAGWALVAVLVEQAAVAWCTRIASAAGPASDMSDSVASNAAYTNALLIYLVPHSLVTVSIVTALFTGMSRFAADSDMVGLRGEISRGLRTIAVFSIFSTVALIALAPVLVRAIVPSATAGEAESVSYVVMAMAIGLVPLGAMVLIKAAYFAVEDGRSLFLIHIPMAIALVGIALAGQRWFEPRWWVVGIGLGMAASNTIAMALRLGGLRRRLQGLDGRRVLRTHLLCALAALPTLAIGWWLVHLAPDVDAPGLRAVAIAAVLCLAIGAAMLAVYGTGLWLLRVREWRGAILPFIQRLRPRVR
ncbi:MAG: murein biosynthesis protein MurJ [Demequinaceae bacterium]|nr:murein biosynthesis protein MurJ [Demequinaceae bacterium]